MLRCRLGLCLLSSAALRCAAGAGGAARLAELWSGGASSGPGRPATEKIWFAFGNMTGTANVLSKTAAGPPRVPMLRRRQFLTAIAINPEHGWG